MISLLLIYFPLIAAVVFFALLLENEFFGKIRKQASTKLEVGDSVIYRKQKVSATPGPRAYDIHPADQGEYYSYFVNKFWTVENVLPDGQILVTTRTKKHHYLRPSDPNLRKAGLIMRLRYRNRFPELQEAA